MGSNRRLGWLGVDLYDLIAALGLVLLGVGFWWVYPALGLIVPGALLLILGVLGAVGRGRGGTDGDPNKSV